MAEVYLAKCFGVAGFERLVALKRILPTIAEDDEFIAMFIDEAKIAGQLNHANVAQIFDLGKINNSYFIAMEYISGHDLRALWDRAKDQGGLPLALACYATKKICEGLDYAHRRRDNRGRPLGIIHRDVSPQNVLLAYDGAVKVIDFGIAKAANRMVRTQTGILKGKFAYMAPEQARGEPTDHRSDVFAIGVILYELLTGERAFKADSDFALLEKVRKVDLVSPRKINAEIPRELERIVYKAMAREAGDRYAWASVMASDLDRFMTNHGLTYNKEELAAFVQRAFREDFEEEERRLQVYKGFRLEGGDDDDEDSASVDDDDFDEDFDDDDDSGVTPDQETQLRMDPSLEDSEEDQIYEAGTELGDAYTELSDDDPDESFALRAAAPTHAHSEEDSAFDGPTYTTSPQATTPPASVQKSSQAKSSSSAGSRSKGTRPRSTSSKSRVAKTSASSAPRSSRRGTGKANVSSPPKSSSRPAYEYSDEGLPEAPTRVGDSDEEPSSAQPTQMLTHERVGADNMSDATMIDSGPLSDSKESEGAGPRGRGTALGDVLGDDSSAARTHATVASSTSTSASAGPGQASQRSVAHHDENLFSGPNRAVRPAGLKAPAHAQSSKPSPPPRNGAPNGAQADGRKIEPLTAKVPRADGPRSRSSGYIEPEVFGPDPSLARSKGVSPAMAAVALVIGVLVALPLGVLAGMFLFADDYDTFILTEPRDVAVLLGQTKICEQTPCTASLGGGTHTLFFEAADYGPTSKEITHPGDQVFTVEMTLAQRRKVTLATEPSGAKVVFNGKRLTGKTPVSLDELSVGDKVRLKITAKGYDTIDDVFEVPKLAKKAPWKFDMVASKTAWTITTDPKDAQIELKKGRNKEGSALVNVDRGKAVAVRVARPGCRPEMLTIQGNGKPTAEKTIKLSCQPFDARLSVRAKGKLQVVIDGVDLGKRKLNNYRLPPGSAEVILRSKKDAERVLVDLVKGQTFELTSELK